MSGQPDSEVIDFEAEGLLGELVEPARSARARLLAELAADGAELEELRTAVEEDRLALLPVERVLSEPRIYSPSDLADRTGMDIDFLERLWQSIGLPRIGRDEPLLTEADLEGAVRAKAVLDAGISEAALLETTRVLSVAMSQVAAATRSLIQENFLRPGDNELDAGVRIAYAARSLVPALAPSMEHILQIQMREQIGRDVINSESLAERPNSVEITAAFADMVGFTALGEQLPTEDLGALTGRFNEMVGDLVIAPVRIVKMIGDAAMMISRDPDALVETVLGLVDEAAKQEDDFPRLRAGVSHGRALTRGGDWFGHPVNTASRLTDIARPSSVLASSDVQDAVDVNRYLFSRAGHKNLKGIGSIEIVRVRLADDEPEEAEAAGA